MNRLRLAVVGVGHLGKEHARILASIPEVELIAVVDANRTQAEAVAARYGVRATTDHRVIIGQVEAAVVAAPTSHHHTIGRELLEHGIHLLIEKPLARTAEEARDLVEVAQRRGLVLQVGHIERFNPAFEELQSHPLQPCYLTCQRWGGFTGRSTDVGVVLDVMIHDLDLVLALLRSPVSRVEAMGVAVLGGHEDMVQARVTFANGAVADLTASRVHPEPVRRMHLWGPEGYAGVDFATRQLTLMQPAMHLRQGRIDSRNLDQATATSLRTELFGKHVQKCTIDCSQRYTNDQLTRELVDFATCVRTETTPRVDGQAGWQALELATQIVAKVRAHPLGGLTGPHSLTTSGSWLFTPPTTREAA